mmetsp:Transcript_7441/g.18718  ORF Transcript_7441/g.18718 Transcript_7441/m.18718 type:complete len:208 (-) Transcript_7441:852-1475(-)
MVFIFLLNFTPLRLMAWSTLKKCVTLSVSWRYAKPSTKASIVKVPEPSTSSIFQVLWSSSTDKFTPKSFISCKTWGCCTRLSNSSLSSSPLPSASPSSKQWRKNSMKALCFCACASRSASLRSEVASIMEFEATAVRTLIIVQETKTMKTTKKILIEGSAATTGEATDFQLSWVVTRKSEKRDVRTSQNKAATSVFVSAFSWLNISP